MAKEALRVATYNIHKCRGLDGRTRPDRIAKIVRDLDADVVALQEVLRAFDGPAQDQLHEITAELDGYRVVFGENRKHEGAAYGNAVLSRLPIESSKNYDLTWRGCERRGCLRADLQCGPRLLHVFNVHLG